MSDRRDGDDEITRGAFPPGEISGGIGSSFGGLRILGQVGVGGQGVVYEAVQEGTGQPVAVKMLRSGGFATSAEMARFEREVQLAARVHDHDNVVRVLGSGWQQGMPYLVMELVDGVPLEEWLAATPGPRERLGVFLEICDAVAHSHIKGVFHRDLKPANVMVTRKSRAKVLDFGTARPLEGPELSRSGEFHGSLAWAAPEQFNAPGDVDARTDVHALGLLLFFLLTGRRPHAECASVPELTAAVMTRPLPDPSRLVPGVSRDLDAIVGKAAQKERKERYEGVPALRDDVKRHLDGFPPIARNPTAALVAWRALRRHPVRAAIVGGVGMLAAFAVGAALRAARAEARAAVESEVAEEVTRYVAGVFDIAGSERGGSTDPWAILDHLYRGIDPSDSTGHPEVRARLLLSLGRAYLAAGVADRASATFGRALRQLENDAKAEPARLADALEGLAGADLLTSNSDSALGYAERALAIRQAWTPDDVAGTHVLLGRIHLAAGDADAAQDHADRAEVALGARGGLVRTATLELHAELGLRRGDLAGATQILQQALSESDRAFNARDARQATLRLAYGKALLAAGRPAEADPVLREALGMRRLVLGVRSSVVADVMMLLGRACLQTDRLVEARLHAEDSLSIYREVHGDEHPLVAEALRLLADVARRGGDIGEAEAREAEALHAMRNIP